MARFHAHAVHEGDVEAAEFAVFVFAEVVEAAALDGAAASAGEDDGELSRIVRVAVHEAAGEQDHAVFQQGALAFVRGLHLGEELGPEFDLMFVHALIHAEAMLVAGMVGELVDAAADAVEAGEAHVREVVVHHEGGDARAVHLEGEEHDVEHEAQVVLAAGGDAGGGAAERDGLHGGLPTLAVGLGLADFFGELDALLDLAHGGQILVELLLVATAELRFEAAGVFEHEVEDAFVALAAAAVVKELVEGLLREDFLRRGRGGRAPGDVGGVNRREAAVGAVAGPLGAEHDAGHGREFASVRGDELIHRGADLDIGGGLFHLQAAEHVHLRVMAAFAFDGGGVPQALKYVYVLLEPFERR